MRLFSLFQAKAQDLYDFHKSFYTLRGKLFSLKLYEKSSDSSLVASFVFRMC